MPTRLISEVIEGQQILTCSADSGVREICRRMTERRVGAVMVVDGQGKLRGIFTERDALGRVLAAGRDPDTTTVGEVMTPDPLCVSAQRALGHALHLMYDNGFRHVPVVEGGRPLGMVSARDALGAELCAFEDELERREQITELL